MSRSKSHLNTSQSRADSSRRCGDESRWRWSEAGRPILIFALGAATAMLVAAPLAGSHQDEHRGRHVGQADAAMTAAPAPAASRNRPRRLDDLLAMSPAQLRDVDVALMNLLCAQDLPAAPGVPPATSPRALDTLLHRLDQMALRVAAETDRHLYRFRRNPADFNQSEGYFRVLTMITVLQQDFGVHYNPARINAPDWTSWPDLFIQGLLARDRSGTCASMPVLYVAVGRRLGYPLKLVTARAHVFARWEDEGERFNIEATNQGLACEPDEHYMTWPAPISRAQVDAGLYLRSLAPPEELALMLGLRGNYLEAVGRFDEAQIAYARAHRLAPRCPDYIHYLYRVVSRDLRRFRVANGMEPPPNGAAPSADRRQAMDDQARWLDQQQQQQQQRQQLLQQQQRDEHHEANSQGAGP